MIRLYTCCVFIVFLLTACRPEILPTSEPPPEAAPSLIGYPLKGSGVAVYRLMENGRIRHISNWPTYVALGYQPDQMVMVSDETLAGYPFDLPLTPWLTGQNDSGIYLLKDGQRYQMPDLETFAALGGHLLDISLVPDNFLNSFPLAGEQLPALIRSADDQAHPRVTAALWANGYLWLANETGLLTRWDVSAGVYQEYRLPNEPVIEAIVAVDNVLYLGTATGDIWQMTVDGVPTPILIEEDGWVSALALAGKNLWYADVNHVDPIDSTYQPGRGLIKRTAEGREQIYHLTDDVPHDPLKSVTALVPDSKINTLWVGTRFAGILRYDLKTDTWQQYHSLNSNLADNAIADLKLGVDGTLWAATRLGVSAYQNEMWQNYPLAEGLTDQGAQSLAPTTDGSIWVAGDHYLAYWKPGQNWLVYTALDHPLLADQFNFVVLDDTGPWFIGRRLKLHFDEKTWTAYDVDVRRFAEFTPGQTVDTGITPPPADFPDPRQDYEGWLQTWPRPDHDNGRGLHFLQTHWFDEIETQKHINRMKKLDVRWTLVNYANRYQLMRTAPMFKETGIMVVWRPFVRPYESYDHWAADIAFLKSQGIPPYIQLYNEPSLAQEWNDSHPIDQETFLTNLLPAIRQVYDAGGYVGLQFLNPDWLRITLQRMKAEGMTNVFDRLFFVPHPYGLNHPPEYDEDINSALGFLEFARVFEEELGFVPMMMAGEGGWRPGEAQDNRYPMVDETLHRDYHVAVLDWFRTGQLSNGDPLPDYFFAFCPWLISDPHDPAAWFDSDSGDRVLTIQAVEAMPTFDRRFSWE